jgi:signal transduction histidine kinase
MTIKRKLSILISILLSLLFICGAFIVEFLYSEFRKDEFKKRLEEKALTYVKLLIDVKEVDANLLRIIDKNTVGKLYEEKVLILNEKWGEIYQSPNSEYFHPSELERKSLSVNKKIYREESQIEIIGLRYETKQKMYFVFVAANDQFGKKSLEYLIILLVFSTIILSISGWVFISMMVNRVLNPMKLLHEKISKINEQDLHERIPVNSISQNEIDLLSKEINLLLERIELAYKRQKMFTSHASHELKTPISRIVLQLESLKNSCNQEQQDKILEVIRQAININKLIDSLLILAKMEDNTAQEFHLERIDELIFIVIDEIKSEYSLCKIDFEIDDNPLIYELLMVSLNQSLMHIALYNLLRNAYLYSENQHIKINLYIQSSQLCLSITNNGPILDTEDQQLIFQQFGRGKNSIKKEGVGLGLVIVKRIMDHHQIRISYSIESGLNVFKIHF